LKKPKAAKKPPTVAASLFSQPQANKPPSKSTKG
jgi:hypothetical protein